MPALRFRLANEKEYCEPYCELQAGRAAGACGADGGLVEFFRSRGWNSQPCALSLLDLTHSDSESLCPSENLWRIHVPWFHELQSLE